MEIYTQVEIFSLIASSASIILAIVAIGITFYFAAISNKILKESSDSANKIDKNVEKLQVLFSPQYDRAMGWVEKAFDHSFSTSGKSGDNIEAEVEKKADEKIEKLREEINKEMSDILQKQKDTSGALKKELRDLVDRAISQSRKVDSKVREETLRERILSTISRNPGIMYSNLVDITCEPHERGFVCDELRKLCDENLVFTYGTGLSVYAQGRVVHFRGNKFCPAGFKISETPS